MIPITVLGYEDNENNVQSFNFSDYIKLSDFSNKCRIKNIIYYDEKKKSNSKKTVLVYSENMLQDR